MKFQIILPALLLFTACTKNSDEGPVKLLRTEASDNYGNVFHTGYNYDNEGRVTSITQYKNTEQPALALTITYNGNEAVLVSSPKDDPAYDQTATVHLTLDAGGRTQKRIEYTHGVARSGAVQPTETFRYDTVLYIYDAAGALKKTTHNRYDSTWVSPTYNSITRLNSTADYTTIAGNLTVCDEYAAYPKTIRQASDTIFAGGTSTYHTVFVYTKSYPNRIDFTNVGVLNEYLLYYEAAFNNSYKNLPDKVERTTIDKDINGVVIFSGTTIVDIDRSYNPGGFAFFRSDTLIKYSLRGDQLFLQPVKTRQSFLNIQLVR